MMTIMMTIQEIKNFLDEGKVVVLYKYGDGYAVNEFPPNGKNSSQSSTNVKKEGK